MSREGAFGARPSRLLPRALMNPLPSPKHLLLFRIKPATAKQAPYRRHRHRRGNDSSDSPDDSQSTMSSRSVPNLHTATNAASTAGRDWYEDRTIDDSAEDDAHTTEDTSLVD